MSASFSFVTCLIYTTVKCVKLFTTCCGAHFLGENVFLSRENLKYPQSDDHSPIRPRKGIPTIPLKGMDRKWLGNLQYYFAESQ